MPLRFPIYIHSARPHPSTPDYSCGVRLIAFVVNFLTAKLVATSVIHLRKRSDCISDLADLLANAFNLLICPARAYGVASHVNTDDMFACGCDGLKCVNAASHSSRRPRNANDDTSARNAKNAI